jgi:Amt family ammonium transporter
MGPIDTGDTAWVLAAAALVLFMTPGLALFYGGLVRSKNVLATMMQSVAAIAVVSIVWVLVGYTLAFGHDIGGLIGGLEHVGLHGVGAAPIALAPTVPQSAFVAFQLMFAIITPALIAGAFAERVRFGGYVLFVAPWSVVVYAPLAHWVWDGGFLGPNGLGASISPAAPSCISAPVPPRLRPRCSWGSVAATRGEASRRTTCRWWSSARASCGSAGSGSTPAAR